MVKEIRIAGEFDPEFDALRLLHDGRAVVLRNYQTTSRSMRNTVEEGDAVREDAAFEIIVYDLLESS